MDQDNVVAFENINENSRASILAGMMQTFDFIKLAA